jgi:peptidoglycan/xylan/chitin deacetylase (PgdA/CDA1 family)
VDPVAFERQIAALASNAEIVPLSDLPARVSLNAPLERPLASLTFDDGYENFFISALPILKKYHVPATLFVVTGFVGSQDPMPFDSWSVTNHGSTPSAAWRPIDWSQLEACMQSGLVTVGAHSHCHRNGLESSVTQLEEETGRSRAILRERLGPAAGVAYSYPYGSRRLGQVPDAYVAAVRAAGYSVAVTTDLALVRPGTDPLTLPRVEAHALDSPAVMRAKSRGVLAPYHLTDWLRKAYRGAPEFHGHS